MTGPELREALEHARAACIAGNELCETIEWFVEFLRSVHSDDSIDWVVGRHADAMNEHWEQLV